MVLRLLSDGRQMAGVHRASAGQLDHIGEQRGEFLDLPGRIRNWNRLVTRSAKRWGGTRPVTSRGRGGGTSDLGHWAAAINACATSMA